MITIKVLFFASAREASNTSERLIQVDDGCTTHQFRQVLAAEYPELADMVLDEESITLALNEEYIAAGDVIMLKDGDVIALIPPISGG